MRLVDADALKMTFDLSSAIPPNYSDRAKSYIDAAPTVEPGRCGECEHEKKWMMGEQSWCAPVGFHPSDFGCVHFQARTQTEEGAS